MTKASLQPMVCCLGSTVGGNPAQFALERAMQSARLIDWKLITAEVPMERASHAWLGIDSLGFSAVIFLSADYRRESLSFLSSLPTPQATSPEELARFHWIGEITTAVRDAQGEWHPHHTIGSSIVETLRMKVPSLEAGLLLLGTSSTARSVAWHWLQKSEYPLRWLLNEEESASSDEVDSPKKAKHSVLEGLDEKFQSRIEVIHEGDLSVDMRLAAIVATGDFPSAPIKQWILSHQESAGDAKPVVLDATDAAQDDVSKKSLFKRTANTIVASDWLAEQISIDFYHCTRQQPDRDVVRDALDEYFEL